MSLGVSVPSFSVSEHHYHHWCVLVVAVKLTGVRANRGYFGTTREETCQCIVVDKEEGIINCYPTAGCFGHCSFVPIAKVGQLSVCK